jgi:hypothetical protein
MREFLGTQLSERTIPKDRMQLPALIMLPDPSSLPSLPRFQQMEVAYGQDLERMFGDHNKLIGMILSEEEDLIECHK